MARGESSDGVVVELNEAEGAVLGLIARKPPLTRYQILRYFQNSPVRFQNVSKGSVYPLISRMLDRGMIVGAAGSGGHTAEVYSLTVSGKAALRRWAKRLQLQQMLPLDPLKIRVFTLAELTPTERIEWIASAKQLLLDKKAEMASYRERLLQAPYGEIVYHADQESLEAKLAWLDRLLIEVAQQLGANS